MWSACSDEDEEVEARAPGLSSFVGGVESPGFHIWLFIC